MKLKSSDFFPLVPQGARQYVHWRYVNNLHIHIYFWYTWDIEVTALCSLLGLCYFSS